MRSSACRRCATFSLSWRNQAAIRVRNSRRPPSRRASSLLTDLQPGMMLEGVVTNVAAFGAFVDIGVHQDGLVHVSALANKFVKDPHEVVKPGQIVKVKVMEVDVKRQRISLTMRLEDVSGSAPTSDRSPVEVSAGVARESAYPAPTSTPACSGASASACRHDGHGFGARARQTGEVAILAVCVLSPFVLCRART